MTPTQLEAILAEREACAKVAGKLVRFDRKGADAQQRARADAFQSGQRYAAEQIRNRPAPASDEVGGWLPIESAPKDGTVFIARNADHPSFGSWPMLRCVRHVVKDGEFQCIDLRAWLRVLDIEPDYHEGNDTPDPVVVPFALAADEYNKSVRYEWRPFPAPLSTLARP